MTPIAYIEITIAMALVLTLGVMWVREMKA